MLTYRNHRLTFGLDGDIDLTQITEGEEHPFYLYDLRYFTYRYNAFREKFANVAHTIHYAVKANAHPKILGLVRDLGGGADVVSGGELLRALESGIPADRIIFSGVGKTKDEIALALEKKIKQINVESISEFKRVHAMAEARGQVARVAFRFNPAVNPETHPYIATGFRDHKFGMDTESIHECLNLIDRPNPAVWVAGVTLHIGSQILEIANFDEALKNTLPLLDELRGRGYALESLDVGGGLGVRYDLDHETVDLENLDRYARTVLERTAGFEGELLFEPGRFIVGRCGVLLSRIEYIKRTPHKTFVILGTGMHHLIRPALYQAVHRVRPVIRRSETTSLVDVVGPLCESSDFLAKGIPMTDVEEGDWIAIADAGAYARSMASEYNLHEFPEEKFITD